MQATLQAAKKNDVTKFLDCENLPEVIYITDVITINKDFDTNDFELLKVIVPVLLQIASGQKNIIVTKNLINVIATLDPDNKKQLITPATIHACVKACCRKVLDRDSFCVIDSASPAAWIVNHYWVKKHKLLKQFKGVVRGEVSYKNT